MSDRERVENLMNRLRRLRCKKVMESERSILEVAIRAIEAELTRLGRSLRNRHYWQDSQGLEEGEFDAA